MNRPLLICNRPILALALAAMPLPAHAADIVYAARYYRAGSQGTTHFHLYRIHADGTGRKQLTFGNDDEAALAVSPDGRRIAYRHRDTVLILDTRANRTLTLPNLFTKDQTATGDQTVDRMGWSPDSARLVVYTSAGDTSTAVVCNAASGKVVARWEGLWDLVLAPDGKHSLALTEDSAYVYAGFHQGSAPALAIPGRIRGCWLDDTSFALYNASKHAIEVVPLHGERRTVKLQLPAGTSEDVPEELGSDNTEIIGIPGDPRHVIVGAMDHNSTEGSYGQFFRVDTRTGSMGLIGDHNRFVTPSPDGKQFVTAPPRSLSPLGKMGTAGRQKSVWTAPLIIGSLATGKTRTIQDGLICVANASWTAR